jgi:acyl-coenzyme A thioesterase 7
MVAVDADGKPVAAPPLTLTTPEERTRFEEGRARMQARRASRAGSGR